MRIIGRPATWQSDDRLSARCSQSPRRCEQEATGRKHAFAAIHEGNNARRSRAQWNATSCGHPTALKASLVSPNLASSHMRTYLLFALSLAISCSTPLSAAEAYPRSAVGDTWTYEQFQDSAAASTSNGIAEFRAAWWDSTGGLVILARYGKPGKLPAPAKDQLSVLHTSLKQGHCVFSITDGQAMLHGAACEEPLVTGQSWEFRESGGRAEGIYKLTVLGEEKVTVPAGTFSAIKLAAAWRKSFEASGSVSHARWETRSIYWYVPELKSMVRLERVFLDESDKETKKIIEVLRSYIPARPPSAQQ